MVKPPRPPGQPAGSDAAGGGNAWRPHRGYLAAALLLAVGAFTLVFFLWFFSQPDGEAPPAGIVSREPVPTAVAPANATPPPATAAQSTAPAARGPEGDADPTRDLSHYVMRGEKPTMGEVIKRLHENGVHTGLGAFNPPGTSPPLVGLAVPKDFVLPPGYVRHHQTTDDGQPIDPILMFAPDFQLYDAANKPVAMPKDRVVPPDLAPPGLPLRRISIPHPIDFSGQ
ncbi:hypothetical protein [Pseudoduganella violaceinigra]|uniref:hypothetical protein n=1 Tax=Pseudoduganella violaceinigra TaxID=246602 RepID=UPI000483E381|nr:hypothetical protein [Pseudoduganella violaceinigra]